jgi:GrpB-like predicted nucleotidyltransferase (UPF0157 family)/mannose-6-phosphate isomerase-like protein (cupin superfamily)
VAPAVTDIVRIFRFDPEVSIPIGEHGSSFRLGPLTGPDSRVRVQVMHLAPSGSVGRHATARKQLWAVVAGSGWVGGGDGRSRPITEGQAALWDPGEEHEGGSDGGLTAVCIEGDFEVRALAVTQEIVVVDYDPRWPAWFERLCSHVWPAVQGMALRIDHVGSTSVPGMAAKPIIDMDVVVAYPSDVPPATESLRKLGYEWRGDMGIEGRQAFARWDDNDLPRHHLYLVVDNNRAHLDHILLRDLLRADPEARRRYAELKRSNVSLAQGDMDVYVAAKARLVAELLARARRERDLPPVGYWDPFSDRQGTDPAEGNR